VKWCDLTDVQVTEAILNNQSCFLEEHVWRGVLQSIVIDNPLVPERSKMFMSLFTHLIAIPRLFKDLTMVICHNHDPQHRVIVDLISRAQRIRISLHTWYADYISATVNGRPLISDQNYKILVLYYITSIYSNRLNTCVHWKGTPGMVEMEAESQQFAGMVVSLYKEEAYRELRSCLLLAQKLPIAEATIQTGAEWSGELTASKSPAGLFMMPKQTFKHWCDLFGRKTS
jgi:hypothetical protein